MFSYIFFLFYKKFAILILYFTFVSSLISLLFGFWLGNSFISYLATSFIFVSFLISLFVLLGFIFEGQIAFFLDLGNWFNLGTLDVSFGLIFDPLTLFMSTTVLLISSLVHLYSCSYMRTDPHTARFMGYLSMFTFFMLILIFSNNFVVFFLGWEGIGLSSYLLIGFWYTRIEATKSALKAVFINRISDFFLLLAIFYINLVFGSVDFLTVFSTIPFFQKNDIFFLFFNTNAIFFISLLLFLSAVGKSAQIFLHTWLPDAMEGPTPVSALIHAATMVTAGVFLILRTSFFFQHAGIIINYILIFFGCITIFFSSMIACTQFDIKKIIAYSTCSQLGYMVLTCGLSEYALAFFHMINHAFFKALLFLAAGSIIHSLHYEQDMRKMGGLVNVLPLTYSVFVIATLALTGFPFFSGFYSKDAILLYVYFSFLNKNILIYYILLFSNFLTCFYSCRLIYYVFLTNPSGFRRVYENLHETDDFEVHLTFFILTILSTVSGFYLEELFIGSGSHLFDDCFKVLPINYKIDAEYTVPLFIKSFPTYLSILSFYISSDLLFYGNKVYNFKLINLKNNYFLLDLYIKNKFVDYFNFYQQKNTSRSWPSSVIMSDFNNLIYPSAKDKFYFNYIYNYFFGNYFFEFSNLFFKLIDTNFLEVFGPTNLSFFFEKFTFSFIKNEKKGLPYFFIIFLLFLINLITIFFLI